MAMQLGKVKSIHFRNITNTSIHLQTRLRLVNNALNEYRGFGSMWSAAFPVAQKASKFITQEDLSKPGVYFCFGGDASTFIKACGSKTFFAFDRRPLINESLTEHIDEIMLHAFSEPPEHILAEAARDRASIGYFHNQYIGQYEEIGPFLLLDILGNGGTNVEVFEASGQSGLYKISFDLRSEKYKIYFVQETLTPNRVPSILDGIALGPIMLKQGADYKTNAYGAFSTIAGKFPPDTPIIVDKEIDNPALQQISAIIDKEHQEIFSIIGTNLAGFCSNVFIYRVRR